MSYLRPTIADFKAQFSRDFVYGTDNTKVQDSDITKAFAQTEASINEGISDDQTFFSLVYLYLSAHWLVMDLRMSSQGVAGQFSWAESSKAVGNVSQSFSIPQRILDNPNYSYLTKSNYGAKYLMLILPALSGQIFSVCGGTNP